MRITSRSAFRPLVAALALTSWVPTVHGQTRAELTINDTDVTPESITSSRDGTVYLGSIAKGTIYRAAPGASQAEPWILGADAGLTQVLGVLADDRSNTLWVCQNSIAATGSTPARGQTALRSFDLTSGAPRGTYAFPADPGTCNDIAVSADGTVYASETFRGRIHRLRPGATALEAWVTDPQFSVIDGLAFLGDGSLVVNDFTAGKLFRIPVNADGSAGTTVPLESSLPMVRPDGLRSVGPRTLLQAEQGGRLTELTINGNRAEVRVVRDGLSRAAAVTFVGDSALVLVDLTRVVVVPYRPR